MGAPSVKGGLALNPKPFKNLGVKLRRSGLGAVGF